MDLLLAVAQIACARGFSCSPSVAWCSVKVDGALSSLSGAVGGPVWLNGQSMKPLLAGFLILKMDLLVVLQGTLKASTKASEDLCHATADSFLFSV